MNKTRCVYVRWTFHSWVGIIYRAILLPHGKFQAKLPQEHSASGSSTATRTGLSDITGRSSVGSEHFQPTKIDDADVGESARTPTYFAGLAWQTMGLLGLVTQLVCILASYHILGRTKANSLCIVFASKGGNRGGREGGRGVCSQQGHNEARCITSKLTMAVDWRLRELSPTRRAMRLTYHVSMAESRRVGCK